jgi:hypothetical protein
MCKVLKRVDDCRLSYRMACMINSFKLSLGGMEKNPDRMNKHLLIARHEDEKQLVMAFDDERKRGAARWGTKKAFKKTMKDLFESEEGRQLDLAVLLDASKMKIDLRSILLDLLMYDDDDLVHAATDLLLRRYAMNRNLLRACAEVQLLGSRNVAVFGTVLDLKVNVQNLRRSVSSWAIWGVTNEFGPADTGQLDEVLTMFRQARELCCTPVLSIFQVGDEVDVRYRGNKKSFYGRIERENGDDTFTVKFDAGSTGGPDGARSRPVPNAKEGSSVRKKSKKKSKGGAGPLAANQLASELNSIGGVEESHTSVPVTAPPAVAGTTKHSQFDDSGKKKRLAAWQVTANHQRVHAGGEQYLPCPQELPVPKHQDLLMSLGVLHTMLLAVMIDFCAIKAQGEYLAKHKHDDLKHAAGAEVARRAAEQGKIRKAHKEGHDTMKFLVCEAFATMRAMASMNKQVQYFLFHADIGALKHMQDVYDRQCAMIVLIQKAQDGESTFPTGGFVSVTVGEGGWGAEHTGSETVRVEAGQHLGKIEKVGTDGRKVLGRQVDEDTQAVEWYEQDASKTGKQAITYHVKLQDVFNPPGHPRAGRRMVVANVGKNSIVLADMLGGGLALDPDGIIVRGAELLCEVFRGNKALAALVPASMVTALASFLAVNARSPFCTVFLEFFNIVAQPSPNLAPIEKNQFAVLQALVQLREVVVRVNGQDVVKAPLSILQQQDIFNGPADDSQRAAYSTRMLELLGVLCAGKNNTRCAALMQDTLQQLDMGMDRLAVETVKALQRVGDSAALGLLRQGATTRAEHARRCGESVDEDQMELESLPPGAAWRRENKLQPRAQWAEQTAEQAAQAIQSAGALLSLFTNVHIDTNLINPELHTDVALWAVLRSTCGIMWLVIDYAATKSRVGQTKSDKATDQQAMLRKESEMGMFRVRSNNVEKYTVGLAFEGPGGRKGEVVSIVPDKAAVAGEGEPVAYGKGELVVSARSSLPDDFLEAVMFKFLEAASQNVLRGDESAEGNEESMAVKDDMDMILLSLFTERSLSLSLRHCALRLAREMGLENAYPLVRNRKWATWEEDMGVGVVLTLKAADKSGKKEKEKHTGMREFVNELGAKPQQHWQFLVRVMTEPTPGLRTTERELREMDQLVNVLMDVTGMTDKGKDKKDRRDKKGDRKYDDPAAPLDRARDPQYCPVAFEDFVRKVTMDLYRRLRVYASVAVGAGAGGIDAGHEAQLLDLLARIIQRNGDATVVVDEIHDRKRVPDIKNTAPDKREFLQKKSQEEFNRWGVTDMVVQAICLSNYTDIQGGHELMDSALRLGVALLQNGNTAVQRSLHGKLTADSHSAGDSGAFGSFAGDFLGCIAMHVRTCAVLLKAHSAARAEELARPAGLAADEPEQEDEERAGTIQQLGFDPRERLHTLIELVRLLCEGHNRKMQDLLREQASAQQSFNIVKEVCNVLIHHVGTKEELRGAQPQHVRTMQCCMDFLVEAMQGPCPKNQELIAEICAANAAQLSVCSFDIFKNPSSVSGGVSGRFAVTQLKASAMLLLLSMLEGRTAHRDVHNLLLQSIGAATLKQRIEQVHANVQGVAGDTGDRTGRPLCLTFGKHKRRAADRMASLQDEHDTAFSEGFYLYAVALQLSSVDPGLMTKLQPKVGAKLTKHDRRYAAAFDYISKRIRVVEVCWGVSAGSGSRAIDRIPFVMPEVDEVSEDRKSQLLKQFELGPTKQAEFVKQLRFVSFEPVLTVALCSSVLECAT